MATELFNNGHHRCYAFADLVTGMGIQANQFLIVHHSHTALVEPGGDLIFLNLFRTLCQIAPEFSVTGLDYVIASHQDPDVCGSADKWLAMSPCKLVIPWVWERFILHACKANKTVDRLLTVPDSGMVLPFGDTELVLLPAHFLHSGANVHLYDPVSRILFTGDLGCWMGRDDSMGPVEDFDAHTAGMLEFHQRCMASNRVLRYWVEMVRGLAVDMIVPQHGRYFQGRAMVERLLSWLEELECGVDLMTQDHYKIPAAEKH